MGEPELVQVPDGPLLPVEHRADGVVLVDASAAIEALVAPIRRERGGRPYAQRKAGPSKGTLHHSGGSIRPGWTALAACAAFHARKNTAPLGRPATGRGWPSIGYSFWLPHAPQVVAGHLVVFRCHADDVVTYHVGGAHNATSIGICAQGTFRSRFTPRAKWNPATGEPSPEQLHALEVVWTYLRDRLHLNDTDLMLHSEWGKPACPGAPLEDWVRAKRAAVGRRLVTGLAARTRG